MTTNNLHKYFTIYFIIFGILITLFGAVTSYFLQKSDIQNMMDQKAKEIFEIKINTIFKTEITDMDNFIKAVSINEEIRKYLKTNDTLTKNELEKIFMILGISQNKIIQIRLISKNGMELIKVNTRNDKFMPIVASKAELQDESERDYFKTVSQLKTEQIWHSKIDLNMENGKIELPYKPIMRVALPLLENNTFVGMIIVNILMNDIFVSVGSSSVFEHFILDKDENYILHPDNQFSLNQYKNVQRLLNSDFPEGLNGKGIFTYSLNDVLQNDDGATFVLKEKKQYHNLLVKEKLNTIFIVALVTVLLSFIVAIFISKTPIKIQKALLKAHAKLNEFAIIIDTYIITVTTKPDSTILDVSSAFEKSSGYSKNELVGKKMNLVKSEDHDKTLYSDLWERISKGLVWSGELKNKAKDGNFYWLEQNIIPKINEKGEIESYVSLGVDITAKKELERIASIDKLTGIYNRRMVDEFMELELEIHKRNSKIMSVMILDIDYFKLVNDVHGHQIGDYVLKSIAEIISSNVRKSDIFGRYGGEEFIIICLNTKKEEAFNLAEKIRKAIEIFKFNEVGHKTISFGISDSENSDNCENIIKEADLALYEAKNTGRNKSCIFTD